MMLAVESHKIAVNYSCSRCQPYSQLKLAPLAEVASTPAEKTLQMNSSNIWPLPLGPQSNRLPRNHCLAN